MDKTRSTTHRKIKGVYTKHGCDFFEENIDELYEFLKEANVAVVEDKASPHELIDVAKNFHLLPADALIALTCKHYGIDTILTFDENFKRVPWLKVIP